MKTIIFDIDGTITNMWPIEKSVLLAMTDRKYEQAFERLKRSEISDTYQLFLKVARSKLGKQTYVRWYNRSFSYLLSSGKLPKPAKYPIVDWILTHSDQYHFVYATGGQQRETAYVLEKLGLLGYFDIDNSIDKTRYRFAKKTGRPFARIKSTFGDCVVVTDGQLDCDGATLAQVPCIVIDSQQERLSL